MMGPVQEIMDCSQFKEFIKHVTLNEKEGCIRLEPTYNGLKTRFLRLACHDKREKIFNKTTRTQGYTVDWYNDPYGSEVRCWYNTKIFYKKTHEGPNIHKSSFSGCS